MRILVIILTLLFAPLAIAADKLNIVLDWYPNPNHAPLIIAIDKGYFKEQGLTVELLSPSDPTDPAKWVAAGKADLALTYEPWFLEHVDRGLPLIRIGTLIDKPLNCLVTLKRSGIRDIGDFKGKKVGTTSNSLTGLMLNALLKQGGLHSTDIELITVKYNLSQALLSGKVDIATGMMRNVEVPMIENTGQKIRVFFPEEHGIPNYSELIIVANVKSAHDKRYTRFLAALKKAVYFLDTHPEDAWELFAKHYPEANHPVNHSIWMTTLPYFAEEPASYNPTDWLRFAEFMRENKLIQTTQPISRYAVNLQQGV